MHGWSGRIPETAPETQVYRVHYHDSEAAVPPERIAGFSDSRRESTSSPFIAETNTEPQLSIWRTPGMDLAKALTPWRKFYATHTIPKST